MKKHRIEIKLSEEHREIVQKAADSNNLKLATFIASEIVKRSKEIINK